MPELPEVETMVRGVREHVIGRRILRTEFCLCRRKPIRTSPGRTKFCRSTRQLRISDVRRLAKKILLCLETPDGSRATTVVIEPRMTGLLLVAAPPTLEHRRLCWHLSAESERSCPLVFWDRRGLGTVTLLDDSGLNAMVERLGPDALTLDCPGWIRQLHRTNREIKVALLDQAVVSGIGNLYASEILHLAGISPFRRTQDLGRQQAIRLCHAARHVLAEAIRYEGSTLSDGTYRNALNQTGSYQNHHQVYQRAGADCPKCRRGCIQRVVQAQRSTFFCSACQR